MKKIGPVGKVLLESGSISENIIQIGETTRGVKGIPVLKCEETGTIFLKEACSEKDEYKNRKDFITASRNPDVIRRKKSLKKEVNRNIWTDIGSGAGGLVYSLMKDSRETLAVEPDENFLQKLPEGVSKYKTISDLPDNHIDIATIMHVLEHMENPIKELITLKKKLKLKSKVFIEVPNGNDFILKNCEAFRNKNGFWSDHLILFTEESILNLLKFCGYKINNIEFFQRYPLSNHLHWLISGNPGGHEKLIEFNDKNLIKSYNKVLINTKQTDTLIIEAKN